MYDVVMHLCAFAVLLLLRGVQAQPLTRSVSIVVPPSGCLLLPINQTDTDTTVYSVETSFIYLTEDETQPALNATTEVLDASLEVQHPCTTASVTSLQRHRCPECTPRSSLSGINLDQAPLTSAVGTFLKAAAVHPNW